MKKRILNATSRAAAVSEPLPSVRKKATTLRQKWWAFPAVFALWLFGVAMIGALATGPTHAGFDGVNSDAARYLGYQPGTVPLGGRGPLAY